MESLDRDLGTLAHANLAGWNNRVDNHIGPKGYDVDAPRRATTYAHCLLV